MSSVTIAEPMSLTVRQLAVRWGYESASAGEQVIRRLIRSKTLPAFKAGRAYRIRLVDVEAYEVQRNPNSHSTA